MDLNISIEVIIPQTNKVNKKYPTLYLLHGLSDDEMAWTRQTSIERYVESLELAVVMPRVERSFYSNMWHGPDYWTFLSEEIPLISRSFFPLSDLREDNFIAGLSMGGYGALKWGLEKHNDFASIASLSGVVNLDSIVTENIMSMNEFYNIFGNREKDQNELVRLITYIDKENLQKSNIYLCCGINDFLYRDNVAFNNFCKSTSFDVTYNESQGAHDWDYWDKKIIDVLNWLPINRK